MNGRKEGNRHQNGLGQRNDKLEENNQVVSAVNLYGFKQTVRHRVDIGLDEDHVVHAHDQRENEDQEVIQQSQSL